MILRTMALLATFLLFIPAVQSGCIDDFTDGLSEYKYKKQRVSAVDGTPVLTTNKYLKAMEGNARWQKFIDEVKVARSELAPYLNQKRNNFNWQKQRDPWTREVATGYRRMQRSGTKHQGLSIQKAFEKFNRGQDYTFKAEGSQKVVITPVNKVRGRHYVEIVYDVSGNYFRMQKGIYRKGQDALEFISDEERYIDFRGNIMNTSDAAIRGNKQLLHTRLDQSHFNAIP